jgi:hypothetical protein
MVPATGCRSAVLVVCLAGRQQSLKLDDERRAACSLANTSMLVGVNR